MPSGTERQADTMSDENPRVGSRSLAVVFALVAPPLKYPPGGYDVVYRLAATLSSRGIPAAIAYVGAPEQVPWSSLGIAQTGLQARIARLAYRAYVTPTVANGLLPVYRLIRSVDYRYPDRATLPTYFCGRGERDLPTARVLIATSWRTASFVASAVIHRGIPGYYLIQNREDDPSFSGTDWSLAAETYDLPLRKIVINAGLARRFAQDLPLRIRVGYDETRFLPPGIDLERPAGRIVVPMRAGESRGREFAIAVLREVRTRIPWTQIVSFGEAKHSEVPEWIEHHQNCSISRLVRLYQGASVFFLPSRIEGMSLPTLEAMACGATVVTTRTDGSSEFVENGRNGYLVEFGDVDGAASTLEEVVRDPAGRQIAATAGRVTVTKYSTSAMADSFVLAMQSDGAI
jgi:glycosyltransferase involved in cell wall biosynthesis